jgi:putative ABC transport system permease protein
MRSISALGVRSVRRQAGRYVLTALGAALGVAVLFGVLVTNASIDAGLDRALGTAEVPGVLVQPVGSYGSTMPSSVVGQAAALRDVVRASGSSWVNAKAKRRAGGEDLELMLRGFRSVQGPAWSRRVEAPDEGSFGFEGRVPAAGADEVSLSRSVADVVGVGLGDPLELVTRSGTVQLTVVRLVDVPDENGLVSFETAQRLFGQGDAVLDVWVELAGGASPEAWVAAHGRDLGEGVRMNVRLGQELRNAVAVVQGGFGALGLMAAFVGGFLIYLTLSTSVAERARTWGVLRAVGGHRRQVVRAVLAEAAAVGVVATVVGVVAGAAVAFALLRFTGTLYRLPSTALTIRPASVVTAVALGLLVPPLAALGPAVRAARAEPVDAMRDRVGADGARLGRLWILGAALLGVGIVIGQRPPGDAGIRVAPLVFMLGAVLVVPVVLRPVAVVVGNVSARLVPGLGDAAVKHLVRERSRSAYTLGLVMAVLGMVLALGAVQTSILGAMHDAFRIRYGADVTVWAWNGMAPEVADALRAAPGVDASTVYRSGDASIVAPREERAELSIIEPSSFFALQGFPWADGDDRSARSALEAGDAVLVPEGYAVRTGVGRGERISLQTTTGPREFRVAGVYSSPEPGVRLVTGLVDGERWFGATTPQGVELRAADGVTPEQLLERATAVVGDRPGYFLGTTAGEEREAAARVESNFRPFLAVILLAGIVGALGLANTLGIAILRRTREIGVLRAVGIDRRSLSGMVLVESLTMGGVAFVLSLPLGWALARSVLRSTSTALGFVVDLRAPWAMLPVLAVGMVVLCSVAAAGPARRIARLDPVEALRFE